MWLGQTLQLGEGALSLLILDLIDKAVEQLVSLTILTLVQFIISPRRPLKPTTTDAVQAVSGVFLELVRTVRGKTPPRHPRPRRAQLLILPAQIDMTLFDDKIVLTVSTSTRECLLLRYTAQIPILPSASGKLKLKEITVQSGIQVAVPISLPPFLASPHVKLSETTGMLLANPLTWPTAPLPSIPLAPLHKRPLIEDGAPA